MTSVVIETSDDSKISCSSCGITFSHKKNLYRHMKKFHPTQTLPSASNMICSICDTKLRTMLLLHEHFLTRHPEINLRFETKTFYCSTDFEDWKSKIEVETRSYFTRACGCTLSDGTVLKQFYCHRSGLRRLKTDRKRRLKSGGSNKCGKTCPALIKMYKQSIEEAHEIKVEYQSVHVGHELEVERIPLSKVEKSQLASLIREQISLGIPKTKVVTNVKEQFSTKHGGFIRRKHLWNIIRDFKIDRETQTTPDPAFIYDDNNKDLNDYSVNKTDFTNITDVQINVSCDNDLTIDTSIEEKKSDILTKFQNFLMKAESVKQLDLLYEAVNVIEAKWDTVSDSSKVLSSDLIQRPSTPTCQYIQPQWHFIPLINLQQTVISQRPNAVLY